MRCDWTHIEAQLDVRRGGGICAETAKGLAVRDPVLVIGLGGTGIDAMLQVKNRVLQELRPGAEDLEEDGTRLPGNIAFLGVDTDHEARRKVFGQANLEESEDDLLLLEVPNLWNAVQEIPRDAPEWDWLDPELRYEHNFDGSIRQLGRMLLFLNFQKIKAQLSNVIQTIVYKAQVKTSGPPGTLKIYILTGIGGSTGSGTFLDMAYLLRQLGHNFTPNVQTFGYLFTPDLNRTRGGDVSTLYRNGFAALKELDYWMSTADHGKHFFQRYPGNYVIDAAERPLDFCHIITAKDAENRILDYGRAMDSVADVLAACLTGEAAGNFQCIDAMYDEIPGHVFIAEGNAKYPANYKYLSVGSSAMEIPYREIMTLLAARMLEKLDPVFRRVPDNQSFRDDLEQLKLTYNHLWSDIHYNIGGDPLANGKQFTYNEIAPNNAPYALVLQWLNGYAQQALARNGHNLQANKEGLFTDYMRILIRDPQRGPGYAARLVYSNEGPNLINTMEAFRYESLDRASAAAAKNGMLKSQLDQAYAAVKQAHLFGRGNAVRAYNDALWAWKENDFAYWAYTELAWGLQPLIERLKKCREKVSHILIYDIDRLCTFIAGNANEIAAFDQVIQQDPRERARYLILATEFERRHYARVQKDAETAAVTFLQELGENLTQWLDDNVSDETAATDVLNLISDQANNIFNRVVSPSFSVESLLLERAPVGTNEDDYLCTVVRNLRAAAVPMFHKDVAAGIVVDHERFALISIPDNCSKLSNPNVNWGFVLNETPRVTAERSRIHWLTLMIGLPLFAIPEVTEMEAHYFRGLEWEVTRKGLHLRPEWRETLPSPLPESTWPQTLRSEPQKKYDREKNAKTREAYQLCRREGIIVKVSDVNPYDTTRDRLLYVADESRLQDITLMGGDVLEKRRTLQNLRSTLWGDANTAVRLKAFGFFTQDEDAGVCENTLRFYDLCRQIQTQARIFQKLQGMLEQTEQEDRGLYKTPDGTAATPSPEEPAESPTVPEEAE